MSNNTKGFLAIIQSLFLLIGAFGLLVIWFSGQESYDYILLDVIKGGGLFIGGILTSFYIKYIKETGAL